MALTSDALLAVISSCFCGALILVRCGYRMLSYCRVHTTCHRTWHLDDTIMALSSLPLAARAACIVVSFDLNPSQTYLLPSAADVAASGLTADQLEANYVVARKLLIPSRIFYALYLWCLKLCILNLYYRCLCISTTSTRMAHVLLCSLIITFFAILVPTIGGCRPISLFWEPDPQDIHLCHRAFANLVTMAVLNIATDLGLIIYPFPILWRLHLSLTRKLQLGVLFSMGTLIIMIDLVRLPLIVRDEESQFSRSFWASIEIMGACVVANAAFYYALLKDLLQGHRNQPSSGSLSQRTQVQSESCSVPRQRIAEEPNSRELDNWVDSHSGDKVPIIHPEYLEV